MTVRLEQEIRPHRSIHRPVDKNSCRGVNLHWVSHSDAAAADDDDDVTADAALTITTKRSFK